MPSGEQASGSVLHRVRGAVDRLIYLSEISRSFQ